MQWLKAIGATVLAHAGSQAKADRARGLGADVALSCPYDELAAEVRRVTGGKRAHVVFESVGADSWEASLGSVARTGLIASFGNVSGRPPAFTTKLLADAGSIFVTRPNTFHYNHSREKRWGAAARVFDMIRAGKLTVDIGQRYALADVVTAHTALERRETTGSTILLPETCP